MTKTRPIAFTAAGIAAIIAALLYSSFVYQLGFPDRAISDLAYAERQIAYLAIAVSLFFGLRFAYFGWLGVRAKGGALRAAAIGYALALLTLALIDLWYRANLPGGAGG